MAKRGQANVIGGNYNLRHMKELVNKGKGTNYALRIVRASTRRKGR